MSYDDFVKLFSMMDGKGMISTEESNAMKEITAFRQKYPLQYEGYIAKMRKERRG